MKVDTYPGRRRRKWSRARAIAILGIVIVHAPLFLSGSRHIRRREPPVDVQIASQSADRDRWKGVPLPESEPFERQRWVFEQRAFPLGDIPRGAHARALEAIRVSKRALTPLVASVDGEQWLNLGPSPLLGGQIGITGKARAMSGRVADVAVDPSNLSHWLIGAAQGGIWETRDAGLHWQPRSDAAPSLAMGAIAFAPSNPSIVYAGTGEATFTIRSYAGAGLLKSTNGGAAWTLIATAGLDESSFSDIKVDPGNPNVLVATTARGWAGREPALPPVFQPTGLLKSTDGGLTWSIKLGGQGTDLEVDPTSFMRQYAAMGEMFGGPGNGIFRSVNAGDAWAVVGGPWTSMPGGVGRVEMALAPSNPNVLYVGVQDAYDDAGADGGLLGLYRTDNAWAPTPTWTQIPAGATDNGTGVHGYCGWYYSSPTVDHHCWYDNELIVDPADSSILYAGGIPLWKFDGTNWTEVSQTLSNPLGGIHTDQHALAWAGGRLVVGNDGGVWSTGDGGTTWLDHNAGLSITQFYDGSVHPRGGDLILGGVQDDGTSKWTGGSAWQWIFGGDGADNAISASHPDTDWLVSLQYLVIRRTTDGGETFVTADTGINKAGAPFIARIEKCPSVDDTVVAGTDNLWRSINFFSGGSPSWVSNGPEMGAGITAIAFAPADFGCRTYAFGTADGRLRLTSNAGAAWTDIDLPGLVPDRAVTALAFGVKDANLLYVVLSGFNDGTPGAPGHLFKTTNALSANPEWSDVSPPTDLPHNAIALDSADPKLVFVGTDIGIWRSADAGVTWRHMGPESGMPNVAVYDLQASSGRLVAFTHGRGAFQLVHEHGDPPRQLDPQTGDDAAALVNTIP